MPPPRPTRTPRPPRTRPASTFGPPSLPWQPTRTSTARKSLIGMVHVPALPATPHGTLPVAQLAATAAKEAKALAEAGFDALIVENMHDRPYVHGRKGPEIVAAMTLAMHAVRQAVPSLPIGIQVLSGGNHEAVAIAHATGASFIRCENFVFSHIADEGLLAKAEAGELLRYRRIIGADAGPGRIAIYCDIKKKHASHALTIDLSLADCAEAAEFFGADGLIVTGAATGKPTSIADVAQARRATPLPVLVGSGVTPETVADLFQHAHGLIVGSYLKVDGRWANALDLKRCRKLIAAAAKAR